MPSAQIRKTLVPEIKVHFFSPSRKGWGSQEYIGHVSNYKTPMMPFFPPVLIKIERSRGSGAVPVKSAVPNMAVASAGSQPPPAAAHATEWRPQQRRCSLGRR